MLKRVKNYEFHFYGMFRDKRKMLNENVEHELLNSYTSTQHNNYKQPQIINHVSVNVSKYKIILIFISQLMC